MTIKHAYVFTNLAIITIGGLIFGYWYFLDGVWNPVIDVKQDPLAMETTQKQYYPGDTIYVYYSFCKLRDTPVVTNWRLVDGQVITFAPIVRQARVGCYGVDGTYALELMRIPMNVEPGIWHLEGEASFKVNPIKTMKYDRETLPFEIIPRP